MRKGEKFITYGRSWQHKKMVAVTVKLVLGF